MAKSVSQGFKNLTSNLGRRLRSSRERNFLSYAGPVISRNLAEVQFLNMQGADINYAQAMSSLERGQNVAYMGGRFSSGETLQPGELSSEIYREILKNNRQEAITSFHNQYLNNALAWVNPQMTAGIGLIGQGLVSAGWPSGAAALAGAGVTLGGMGLMSYVGANIGDMYSPNPVPFFHQRMMASVLGQIPLAGPILQSQILGGLQMGQALGATQYGMAAMYGQNPPNFTAEMLWTNPHEQSQVFGRTQSALFGRPFEGPWAHPGFVQGAYQVVDPSLSGSPMGRELLSTYEHLGKTYDVPQALNMMKAAYPLGVEPISSLMSQDTYQGTGLNLRIARALEGGDYTSAWTAVQGLSKRGYGDNALNLYNTSRNTLYPLGAGQEQMNVLEAMGKSFGDTGWGLLSPNATPEMWQRYLKQGEVALAQGLQRYASPNEMLRTYLPVAGPEGINFLLNEGVNINREFDNPEMQARYEKQLSFYMSKTAAEASAKASLQEEISSYLTRNSRPMRKAYEAYRLGEEQSSFTVAAAQATEEAYIQNNYSTSENVRSYESAKRELEQAGEALAEFGQVGETIKEKAKKFADMIREAAQTTAYSSGEAFGILAGSMATGIQTAQTSLMVGTSAGLPYQEALNTSATITSAYGPKALSRMENLPEGQRAAIMSVFGQARGAGYRMEAAGYGEFSALYAGMIPGAMASAFSAGASGQPFQERGSGILSGMYEKSFLQSSATIDSTQTEINAIQSGKNQAMALGMDTSEFDRRLTPLQERLSALSTRRSFLESQKTESVYQLQFLEWERYQNKPMTAAGGALGQMGMAMQAGFKPSVEEIGAVQDAFSGLGSASMGAYQSTNNPLFLNRANQQFGQAIAADSAYGYISPAMRYGQGITQQLLQRQMMTPAYGGNIFATSTALFEQSMGIRGEYLHAAENARTDEMRGSYLLQAAQQGTQALGYMSGFAETWLRRYPTMFANVSQNASLRIPTIEGVGEALGGLMGGAGITDGGYASQIRGMLHPEGVLSAQPGNMRTWGQSGSQMAESVKLLGDILNAIRDIGRGGLPSARQGGGVGEQRAW